MDATTPGLIYFYFENELGVTARLYVGASSNQGGSTSFDYAAAEITGGNGARAAVRDGAMETAAFLSSYVPGTGLTHKTVPPPSTGLPTEIVNYTVNSGRIIQGELYVTNLSAGATFYVYADDCSGTPCPSLQNVNLQGDGIHRRGNFADATFQLNHDYTSNIESGGFAWYDVVGGNSCITAITGTDPFNAFTPKNSGDYGMPISIYGTAARAQFWYVMGSPSGEKSGDFAAFPFYLHGMTDPSTGVDVSGTWALAFPASNPPTPSPQPTATPVICCTQSALMGKDPDTTARTITWIPSGGVGLPARFWYNVSTGQYRSPGRRYR